jgi:3-keto-5-aminohexanoate cleavage enzyme
VNAPLIVTAAICGGEHGREATPHLPMTPAEIADSVEGAVAAGAAIAHLHMWDDAGRPTQDLERYREVASLLAGRGCDVVLNLTTGPGGEPSEQERMLPLRLRPELASFDAGSMNFGDGLFRNELPFLRRLAAAMRAAGTRPELEVFDLGMLATCLRLRDEGLLDEPLHVQFVLGVRGGAPAGTYTVNYRATSADGHVVTGSWSYRVTTAATAAPASSAVSAPQPSSAASPSSGGLPAWPFAVAAVAVVAAGAVWAVRRRS